MKKEKPILFSGEMVRAILEGRKTQTRRPLKPQPIPHETGGWRYGKKYRYACAGGATPSDDLLLLHECPYGLPGDLLWVRETWAHIERPHTIENSFFEDREEYIFAADNANFFADKIGKWRPSIHMPRAASRLTLEITNIRIERLLSITESDAIAEGVETWPDGNYKAYGKHAGKHSTARGSYFDLWNSINPENLVKQNPWVWVIEFAKI